MTLLPELHYAPSPNQSSRRGAPITLVVCHSAEGGYAGAVSWLRNPASQASAHLVLREDGCEATQLVPFGAKAWHAATFNRSTLGLELAGFLSRRRNREQIRRAARIVAFLCRRYRLPPRWRRNPAKRGFCRHADLGPAGSHTADTALRRREWLYLVARVKWEYRRGGFRREWGRD